MEEKMNSPLWFLVGLIAGWLFMELLRFVSRLWSRHEDKRDDDTRYCATCLTIESAGHTRWCPDA